MIDVQNSADNFIFKHNKLLIALCVLGILPITFFLTNISLLREGRFIVLFGLMPLFLLILPNFKLTLYLFIASLFIEQLFWRFYFPELVVMGVMLSFIVTHKYKLSEFGNKINLYFAIFIAGVIPSVLFSEVIVFSFLRLYHLLAFFILYNIIAVYADSYKKIKSIILVFLGICLVNSFYIYYEFASTGNRVYGFAGLIFVDLIGIAIIIAFVTLLYYRKHILLNIFVLVSFIMASIFTQTRGVWLITTITILMIVINFIIKSEKLGFSRKRVVKQVFVIFFLFAFIILAINTYAPSAFSRLNKLSPRTTEEMAQNIDETNSTVSRFFIWITAWEAFKAKPVIGTGIYSFPFVSKTYTPLDPIVYELYVSWLDQHTTILFLLSDVGIIGTIAFLIYYTLIIRFARKSVKQSKTKQQLYYSSVLFWLYVYSCFGMIISDIWFFGTILLVLGLIHGFTIANRRLIENSTEPATLNA